MEAKKKALFLDRDGTLIVDKEYLSNPDEVELIPGVQEVLTNAVAMGYEIFVHTNQSGIGRGYYNIQDAFACNDRMEALLDLPAPGIIQICIAPEAPDQPAVYRKPSPKFLNKMVEKYNLDRDQCWMIGDKLCDLQAGVAAGMNTAWVATGKPKDEALAAYMKEHGSMDLIRLSELLGYLE